MKTTPEEILYQFCGDKCVNDGKSLYHLGGLETEIIEAMKAYHAQFEQSEKVCKWKMGGFINVGVPGCKKHNISVVIYDNGLYCPFCGRKIERI